MKSWKEGVCLAALGTIVLGGSGCGFTLGLTARPNSGGTVTFNASATNPSACPRSKPVLGLLPFFSLQSIEDPSSPVFTPLEQVINATCTGSTLSGLPAGLMCEIVSNNLQCTFSPEVFGTTLPPSLGFKPPVTCEDSGGQKVCKIPLSLFTETFGAPSTASATSSVMCENFGIPVCEILPDGPNTVAPGGTVTAQFDLSHGLGGGTQNLLFAISTSTGVCAGGGNAGDPCSGSSDCPSSTCEPGICVDGTSNNGNGCANSSACPGGSCTACLPDGVFAFSLACALTPPLHTAPLLSPTGVAVGAMLLGAVGVMALRRRRQHLG